MDLSSTINISLKRIYISFLFFLRHPNNSGLILGGWVKSVCSFSYTRSRNAKRVSQSKSAHRDIRSVRTIPSVILLPLSAFSLSRAKSLGRTHIPAGKWKSKSGQWTAAPFRGIRSRNSIEFTRLAASPSRFRAGANGVSGEPGCPPTGWTSSTGWPALP